MPKGKLKFVAHIILIRRPSAFKNNLHDDNHRKDSSSGRTAAQHTSQAAHGEVSVGQLSRDQCPQNSPEQNPLDSCVGDIKV